MRYLLTLFATVACSGQVFTALPQKDASSDTQQQRDSGTSDSSSQVRQRGRNETGAVSSLDANDGSGGHATERDARAGNSIGKDAAKDSQVDSPSALPRPCHPDTCPRCFLGNPGCCRADNTCGCPNSTFFCGAP